MNFNKLKTSVFFSTFVFMLLSHSQINAQCETNLTPGSSIIDSDHQALLSSWLPDGFEYQANLIYDSSVSGSFAEDFHAACDGFSNTVVLGITEDGNIVGGYNEGAWASSGGAITGLNDNFLFSISSEETFSAIPGETHITNTTSGIRFGGGNFPDLSFFSNVSMGVIALNQLGSGYECPASNSSDCALYMNDNQGWNGNDDRFRFAQWEVWHLQTSGTSIGIDTDGDGICNADEIVGCQNPSALNYDSSATDAGDCEFLPCAASLTPGSELLTNDGQALLLSWLPVGFDYEAELVMDSDVSGFNGQVFHSICDGLSNTVLVARTLEGNIIGGYNEGVWASDGQEQFNLDNNFLYSITTEEKFDAIPGQPHIYNSSFPGPIFGGSSLSDYKSFSDNGSQLIIENLLGNSYECPAVNTDNCAVYMNQGIGLTGNENRFIINSFEIWQLKTSGTPAYAEDVQGGCTDDEALNYNALATCSTNSCIYSGCTNSSDTNYNPEASYDDGSCLSYCPCPGDLNGDSAVTISDLSGFLASFGTFCE